MRLDCDTPVRLEQATASDGYTLTYRHWGPEDPRGSVVLLNGIMSHSAWFFPLVDPLVGAGLSVVGADRRGSGLNDVARGDAPSAQTLVDDALAIIAHAVPPGRPLWLVGWCWGSVLGLNLVRPLGERLTGFVMVAPGLFPGPKVTAAAQAHEAAAALTGAADDAPVIETPIAETMFTTGPHLEAFIRTDERRLMTITPRFRAHMSKLAMGAMMRVRKLDLPLLVLLAEGDEATDNDAVKRAIARLDPHQLEVHSTVSGHAMQFDAPTFVTDRIIAFADTNV